MCDQVWSYWRLALWVVLGMSLLELRLVWEKWSVEEY